MQRADSLEDTDAGKDWGQEEKGTMEDEMVGWHHLLNGNKFEQALEDSEGQGSLVCCSPWGWDMTEWLNNKTSCFFSKLQVYIQHLQIILSQNQSLLWWLQNTDFPTSPCNPNLSVSTLLYTRRVFLSFISIHPPSVWTKNRLLFLKMIYNSLIYLISPRSGQGEPLSGWHLCPLTMLPTVPGTRCSRFTLTFPRLSLDSSITK